MANERSIREYKARIQRVVDYVEKNIQEKLPLEVLAGVSCFSPYHFHRIFRAFVGETPTEFVSRIRLEKAASRLITYPSETVTGIAFKTGFSSPASFARAFREHFGCTATDWRSGRLGDLEKGRNRKANSRKREAGSPAFGYVVGEDDTTTTERMREMLKNPEIRSMPSYHVAYLAHLEGYNERIGGLFDRLFRWAGPRGLLTPETKFIGTSLDNPKVAAPEKCRYYACMTMPQDVKPGPEISLTDIPAARCAVARFEGLQPEIPLAYDELFGKFIPEHGYQPADQPAYEIYYDGPQKNPERKFTLDLCVPVEPMEP